MFSVSVGAALFFHCNDILNSFSNTSKMFSLWAFTAPTLLFLYILCDVNYFVRVFFTVFIGRMFQRKLSIHDTSVVYGICTPQDVDIGFREMRVARILRELDFARYDYYCRTGLHRRSLRLGIKSLQGATQVIVLSPIPLFTPYKIVTRLVYWDDISLFFHHEVTTLADGCSRALLTSRQHAVGGSICDLLKDFPGSSFNRLCPTNIRMWLDMMLVTSAKLRRVEYDD